MIRIIITHVRLSLGIYQIEAYLLLPDIENNVHCTCKSKTYVSFKCNCSDVHNFLYALIIVSLIKSKPP